jgi:CRP-like cAMP-binding protein
MLRRVPSFAGLTDEQLTYLAASVGEQRYERGEVIFHQGDSGDVLYIILRGQVRIYRVSVNGQESAVTVFCDGDFFGELALLDGQPRSASAVAMCPTTTLTLHRAAFLHTINTCPPIAAAILEEMAARLRQSSASVEQLASQPATRRVARQLLDLAQRRSSRVGDGARPERVELVLTQDDLASMSGTTRETVNRVLGALRDKGLIRIERARVSVLSVPQLKAAIELE